MSQTQAQGCEGKQCRAVRARLSQDHLHFSTDKTQTGPPVDGDGERDTITRPDAVTPQSCVPTPAMLTVYRNHKGSSAKDFEQKIPQLPPRTRGLLTRPPRKHRQRTKHQQQQPVPSEGGGGRGQGDGGRFG